MFLGNANSAGIGTTIWEHLFCSMIFTGYFIVSYVDISLFSQFILRQIGCINIFAIVNSIIMIIIMYIY